MRKSHIAMVFSTGKVYEGDEGVMYDGPPPKFVNITGCSTLDSIRSKIHARLNLNNNEMVTTVVYRFPYSEKHYTAFELVDDEDLLCALEAYEGNILNAMELYIDIQEVEIDVRPPEEYEHICDNAGPSTRANMGELQGNNGKRRTRSTTSQVRCDDAGCGMPDVNITTEYIPIMNSSVAGISPESEHPCDNADMGDDENIDDEGVNVMDVVIDTCFEDEEGSSNDDDGDDGPNEATKTQDMHASNPLTCEPTGMCNQQSRPVSHNTIPPTPMHSFINQDALGGESEFPGVIYGTELGDTDELFSGRLFKSKSALIHALKVYHVRRHYSYRVMESSTTKMSVRCEFYGDQCNFAVRASNVKNMGTWRITKFSSPHSCVNSSLTQDHKLLDSEFICSCIIGMIKVEQDVPVALIQEKIDSDFGYKVSYKKAWKAKQKAIVRVHGDWNQSYEVLPQLMDMLEYSDQVIYKLECDPFVAPNHIMEGSKRVFNRLFWAFKPCIASFPHCKQFIQVDGTHLYGKHKGVLLIAMTQDGNRCPVPLAFGIVEKENNDNWSWFLGLLRIHVTQTQGLCLISYRHHSIINAVANENLGWQHPHAYHCFCIRHIGSNIMRDCRDKNVRNFIIKIAYEPRQSKVQAKLENLRMMNEEIHKKMTDIPLEQWCLAYDNGRRYGHMTTNIVECINGIFKGIRKLPIIGLVRSTFYRCAKYWVDRATETQAEINAGFQYTSMFRKEIDAIQSQSSSYHVRSFNKQGTHFEVVEGHDPITGENGRVVQVLLDQRQCECGRFQALRYPCSHVIAACASCNIPWDSYVDDVYKLQTVYKCYKQEWWPLGDFTKWHNMDGAPTVVPNPVRLRKKGRPKSTRIRNEMDWPQEHGLKQKCRHCKQGGHNRRKCPKLSGNPGLSTT